MNVLDGKVMRVNLSTGEVDFENYEQYTEWIGGQGVNQFILFNELPLGISPYHPSNILTLGTGALVGTSAPGASRVNIDTINALTGGIGSANAGGHFGSELRFAGINNIVITGKANELVYLSIDDERVEIVSASHLRNMTVSETAAFLHKAHSER